MYTGSCRASRSVLVAEKGFVFVRPLHGCRAPGIPVSNHIDSNLVIVTADLAWILITSLALSGQDAQ